MSPAHLLLHLTVHFGIGLISSLIATFFLSHWSSTTSWLIISHFIVLLAAYRKCQFSVTWIDDLARRTIVFVSFATLPHITVRVGLSGLTAILQAIICVLEVRVSALPLLCLIKFPLLMVLVAASVIFCSIQKVVFSGSY
jgi:hypothetical protein